MRGITIIKDNEKVHTGDDLDLVQTSKDIGMPDIQSYLVEVPGRNGLVNLTKGLTGEVTYQNRTLKFTYVGIGKREDLLEILDQFNNYHGETLEIIDDDTNDYYYTGEATVKSSWSNNILTLELDVNADPFRLALVADTIKTSLTLSGKDLVIANYGVTVAPVITVEDHATIKVGSNSYDFGAGTYQGDIKLKTGANTFVVSGSGALTITYREAKI